MSGLSPIPSGYVLKSERRAHEIHKSLPNGLRIRGVLLAAIDLHALVIIITAERELQHHQQIIEEKRKEPRIPLDRYAALCFSLTEQFRVDLRAYALDLRSQLRGVLS